MEPPSLVLDITRLCPALVVATDLVDRVRSAEHAHVVSDVLWTPRRGVCGACGWGEIPCQRHVSPHNPSRFETTVGMPRQRPFRRHAAGPNPMYQPLSYGEGVGRCDWMLVRVVSTFAWT